MVMFAAIPNALWATLLALVTITVDHPVVQDGYTLNASDREQVAQQLVALRERTGVQMAVVFLSGSLGEPIEDFSHRTANAWRGGEEGRSNGLLLTFALADRAMRLEVGYGLEAAIPDEDARAMLDEVRPLLRQREYAAAATSVISQVSARIGAGGRGSRPLWVRRIGHRREGFLLVAIVAMLAGGAYGIYASLATKARESTRNAVAIGAFGVIPIALASVLAHGPMWWVGMVWAGVLLAGFAWGITSAWTSGYGGIAVCALVAIVATVAVVSSEGATSQWGETMVFLTPLIAAIAGVFGVFPGMVIHAVKSAPAGQTLGGGGGSWSSSDSSSSWSSSSSYDSSSSYSSSSSSSDYSSSSSSSSSDWSGGGGDFGGGGASSSW